MVVEIIESDGNEGKDGGEQSSDSGNDDEIPEREGGAEVVLEVLNPAHLCRYAWLSHQFLGFVFAFFGQPAT